MSGLVIELGCGPGHHLAHLVEAHGITGVGVDIVTGQIERARTLYGYLPGITFVTSDATEFLREHREAYAVCYSVFGAVGLTPPDLLLSAISAALRPSGLLAFSVPHPSRRHRDNTLLLPSGDKVPIQRWEPAIPDWMTLLAASDLEVDEVRHLTGPDLADGPTTLLIVAHKP
ncbi:class I SAM-dependent methyltransferase [Sphaerimonospora thailandensis]|uniref:class I SAM-dependent methyltransferase n=1 Tax=Sphaerimonospora thailandensis TaxID=795644 RepID=UPI00195106D7|nr:class I SAM-dependent methyltransferase [Sphaerimonospora thailandensis]